MKSNKLKMNIVRLKSLSKKELDSARESIIKLSGTNPDQITIVIDDPTGGNFIDVLTFVESIRLTNCNVSAFAQRDLDLSGLLLLTSCKKERGKRLFSSHLKTDLSGATEITPETVETIANYISNKSNAEKAEVKEWIRSRKILSSNLMKEKKLIDDLGFKGITNKETKQPAVVVQKETAEKPQ